jgi:hypothetical protein
MSIDVVFAYVVGVLAGLAVIGALAFALVWEWCAIRRTLAAHRHQAPDGFWRDRGSLLVLGVDALVRQQRAPSPYTQPRRPERYRVADDLRRPLADVVAAAEQEAITTPTRQP